MNLIEIVEKIKREGYNEANAEARLCQDIIINAIAKSDLNRNITIKGGVVMRSLSNEVRRATQDISYSEESACVLINSKAQMIAEKLKSLLRFGTRSTRYKDVFDICYLSELVDLEELRKCIGRYIFSDNTLGVSNMEMLKKGRKEFLQVTHIKSRLNVQEKTGWICRQRML